MGSKRPAEASETPPLIDLHIQMLKLAAVITRPMQIHVAEPHGMFADDVKVMICLADRGTLTGSDLSELLALHPMAASRAIDRLEDRGLLTRHTDREDRRRRPVSLSARGREAHQAMQPEIGDIAHKLYGKMTAAERKQLFAAITHVLESPAFDTAQLSSTEPPST